MSQAQEPKERRETKEWTVMFYFASDNPLAPSAVQQLKAIKNAGYHPEANVLAQFDPHTVNTPSHIFEVNGIEKRKNPDQSDVGFAANDPFVRNLVADKLWNGDGIRKSIKDELLQHNLRIDYDPPIPPESMSNEQNPRVSLANFLDFCRAYYPARHYILFLIGHGLVVGNDLFLHDEHGGKNDGNGSQNSLRLTDLGEVLNEFKDNISEDDEPGEFELVGFHSCSMSGVEVALELKGTAKYMLASQGPAFIGSWPYRSILIRLFNDLNSSSFDEEHLVDGRSLVDKLRGRTDAVSRYICNRINGDSGDILNHNSNAQRPEQPERLKELVSSVVRQFNRLLSRPDFWSDKDFKDVALSPTTEQLLKIHKIESLCGPRLKLLNRLLLADAYPNEIGRINTKRMVSRVFYYCLYNSYDFQLAGYSFDLCLCDLNKIHHVKERLDQLSSKLVQGLEYWKTDPLLKDLILLAHWEAQSYYSENYTDLYDFCFRLVTKCNNIKPASLKTEEYVNDIRKAADQMMDVLKRGKARDDEGVIVRCEFAGPAFQYSHGLSIFFPWSEPVGSNMWNEQYGKYKMNSHVCDDPSQQDKWNKPSDWRKFLKVYFKETKRAVHGVEKDDRDQPLQDPNLDQRLLELFQTITTRSFNDDGQLTGRKAGSLDPLGPGKAGSLDPMGSDCDCGSIKNYPSFTRASRQKEALEDKDGRLPVSPNFFPQFRSEVGFVKPDRSQQVE